MKKMIFAAVALVAMTACNTSLIERPQSEYGTISLGITADVEMMVTKAGEGETTTVPSYDDYEVTLASTSTSYNTTKTYAEVKEDGIKVPAGTYTITVENITAEEAEDEDEEVNGGKGAVRVMGTGEVKVEAGQTKSANVQCSPVNTKVTVDYADGFTSVFTEPTVTLQNTEVEGKTFLRDAPLTMTPGHEEDYAVYYNTTTTATINGTQTAVAALTATITATIGSTEKTFTKDFNAPVAKWTQLTFAVADGNCTLIITVDGTMTVYKLDSVIDPTEGE